MTKQRLESLRSEMQKCTRCSLCKMVPMPTVRDAKYANACPPVNTNHFHAYSGGGLQVMALSLIDGRIEVDEDLARVAFACTTCGLCDVSCKFIMEAERQDVILALREHIVAEGHGPKAHEAAAESLTRTGYANGPPSAEQLGWAKGLGPFDLTLTVNRADLNRVMMGVATFDQLGEEGKARFEGDRTALYKLRDLMVTFSPDFEFLPGSAPSQRQVPPGRPFMLPTPSPGLMAE